MGGPIMGRQGLDRVPLPPCWENRSCWNLSAPLSPLSHPHLGPSEPPDQPEWGLHPPSRQILLAEEVGEECLELGRDLDTTHIANAPALGNDLSYPKPRPH